MAKGYCGLAVEYVHVTSRGQLSLKKKRMKFKKTLFAAVSVCHSVIILITQKMVFMLHKSLPR